MTRRIDGHSDSIDEATARAVRWFVRPLTNRPEDTLVHSTRPPLAIVSVFLFVFVASVARTSWSGPAPRPTIVADPPSEILQELRIWQKRYRAGAIELLIPDRESPGARPRFLDERAMFEVEDLFDAAALEGRPESLEILTEIATTYLTRDPDREYTDPAAHDGRRLRWVRERARRALASIEDRDLITDWARALLDDERGRLGIFRRELGAQLLGDLRSETAPYHLRRRLDDEAPRVRMAVIDSLARIGGETAAQLVLPALSDPDPAVRAAALELLRSELVKHRQADPAHLVPRSLVTRITRMLVDESWWVRRSAVEWLRVARDPVAVPALVDALLEETLRRVPQASPRVARAIRSLLMSLTGQSFPHHEPREWKKWLESLPERERVQPANPGGAGHYHPSFYGVTLRSPSILFVIDLSGSMAYPGSGSQAQGASSTARRTKLGEVQQEMIRAISNLRPGTYFDLVFFNTTAHRWRGEFMEATPKRIEAAIRFIQEQKAGGATDLYAALETALDIGEPGRPSPIVGREVDDVVLLSDGWPSSGSFLDPDVILDTVSSANRNSRTRIHAIEIPGATAPRSGATPVPMLEELAARNGGQYRRVDMR